MSEYLPYYKVIKTIFIVRKYLTLVFYKISKYEFLFIFVSLL